MNAVDGRSGSISSVFGASCDCSVVADSEATLLGVWASKAGKGIVSTVELGISVCETVGVKGAPVVWSSNSGAVIEYCRPKS